MFEPAVLAVQYMVGKLPKRLTGIRVFFRDGTSTVFSGPDLAAALAVVKIAFPPRPGRIQIRFQITRYRAIEDSSKLLSF